MDDKEISLVSVGIPAYNRPDGLRRTLQQITQQTYKQIEIIVSDNCSESDEVRKVVETFMENDTRIKYFRQDINRGALFNFQFVLQKAKGEYFMWAADDDEWDPVFIETCLKYIGNAGSSMQSKFKIIYRTTNQTTYFECEPLSENNTSFENIIPFLQNTNLSLFYGLYKRKTILHILGDKEMDGNEWLVLIRHILNYGINTFPHQLYTIGYDSDQYQVKPIVRKKNKLFSYSPLIKKTTNEIFKSNSLSLKEKFIVTAYFFKKMLSTFINYEKNYRPKQVLIAKVLLKPLICTNNIIRKIARTTNYSTKK